MIFSPIESHKSKPKKVDKKTLNRQNTAKLKQLKDNIEERDEIANYINIITSTEWDKNSSYNIELYMLKKYKETLDVDKVQITEYVNLYNDIRLYYTILRMWTYYYITDKLQDNGSFFCSRAKLIQNRCVMEDKDIKNTLSRLSEKGYIKYYTDWVPTDDGKPNYEKKITFYIVDHDKVKEIYSEMTGEVIE